MIESEEKLQINKSVQLINEYRRGIFFVSETQIEAKWEGKKFQRKMKTRIPIENVSH